MSRSAAARAASPPASSPIVPAVDVPLLGYEVDFLWPEARFVVEADGGDHLDPEQRDKDNARDIALGRAGYLVRRYSSGAMGSGEAVARDVLAILAEPLHGNWPLTSARPR
jgi:very-short-patch-repair endonuclease